MDMTKGNFLYPGFGYGLLVNTDNRETSNRLEENVFLENGGQTTEKGHGMSRNPLVLLARPAGFEPATYGFVVRTRSKTMSKQK